MTDKQKDSFIEKLKEEIERLYFQNSSYCEQSYSYMDAQSAIREIEEEVLKEN